MIANNSYPTSSVPRYDVAITRTDEEPTQQHSRSFNIHVQTDSPPFIFRLPTEILESIFIDCARDHHSKDNGRPIQTVPRWVNVSYVCRHWRKVALECPTLWTYLFVMSSRWMRELLARSKQAPLKLHAYPSLAYPFTSEFCFAEPVMNHIERIQELHLHIPHRYNPAQYFSKLSSPAPHLQNLKISVDGHCLEWPSVLFDGDAPALRTLELSHCSLPWNSFKLSGLTTLSLRLLGSDGRQNPEEFLATLSCMQDLRHLYLDNVLNSAAKFLSSTVFQTFRKINLLHLSRLLVVAPLSTVIALLSCIVIPMKTEVRLQCYAEGGHSPDSYAPLLSLLAQRFDMSDDQTPSNPKIRSLIAEHTRWGNGKLRFSGSDRDCDYYPSDHEWGCNVPLKFMIRFNHPMPDDRDRIITDICCSLPLTNVQSLNVIDPPFSSAFLTKTFGHLHDLRYLKLSRGEMPDLASILSLTPHGYKESQGEDVDGDLNQIFAPALEELKLEGITFPPNVPPGQDMDGPTAGTQTLYDALSTRKGSQGRLTMSECVIEGHVAELDLVGKWQDGDFHIVEEWSRPWSPSWS